MSPLSAKSLRSFHRRLHKWYAANGRKALPWRNTKDAYKIYVSEIMLQQTQVKTVLERYYAPFLKRFPSLKLLAEAPQSDVLAAWEGLGYYNRAINLHKTAKLCKKTGLPKDIDALEKLPGIGRNTACAVAAFAYHQPVPVMEANVRRVLARIYAIRNPTLKALWQKAELLLDADNPYDYNQAMMDIGATVCTKTSPKCTHCPASTICAGKFSPQSFPQPKEKAKVPVRTKNIVVFMNDKNKIYASARKGRFLAGLYHFIEAEKGPKTIVFEGKRYGFKSHNKIGAIRQQYSHFTLEADVYLIKAGKLQGKNWYRIKQFRTMPKSMVENKILGLLDEAI